MPTPTETMPLVIGVETDFSASDTGVKNWDKQWRKAMTRMEKASQKSMKGTGKAIADFHEKLSGAQKKWGPEFAKGQQRLEALTTAFHRTALEVNDLTAEIEGYGKASTASAKEAVANLTQQREALKKLNEERAASVEATQEKLDEIKETHLSFDTEDLVEAAEEAGRAFISPFTAFRSKDLPGALSLLSKGLQKAGSRMGDALLERAAKMKHGGALSKAGGAGIEKMVGMFSKLAPIIGIISSLTTAFVKLLIDAEATVKEINKEVLATASTGQYLTRSFGDASVAALSLEGTLKKISDAALSLNNIGWGISKETHTAVISSLTAEGVSLKTLEQQYGALNAETSQYSDSFGSITEMAVTYSRLMGVSLQEITSLQGEMMTEMGKSVIDVQRDFSMMRKEADAAGISENKFFAMIRGVSADLSLYNTRIEDAVHLLGALGKVMSPRNAQQFMSTAMNAYKGMSFQEKVQSSLLAGPEKFAKIVAADIASKNASIAQKISEASGTKLEDVVAALNDDSKAGRDQVKKYISGAAKDKQGTLREAVSNLDLEKKRHKGGLVGNAAAISQVNGVGAMEAKYAAATRFGKPGEGIGGEVGAGVAGSTPEEVLQMKQMAEQVEDLRTALMAKDSKGGWEKATWQEILATDVEGQKSAEAAEKKAQEDAAREAAFAKKQGENISTVTDKIGVLVDWALGKFYGLFKGLYDMLAHSSIFGNDAAKRQMELIQAVENSKDKDVSGALTAAGGDVWKFRGELMKSDAMQQVLKAIDPRADSSDPEHQKARQDFVGAASASEIQKALEDALGAGVAGKMLDTTRNPVRTNVHNAGTAEASAQADPRAQADKISKLSQEDQAKFIEKLGHWMDPTKLAQLLPELKANTGVGGKASGTPSAPTPPTAPTPGDAKPPVAGEPKPAPAVPVAAAPEPQPAALAAPAPVKLLEQAGVDAETANALLDGQKGTLDSIFQALRQRGIKIEKIGNAKAQDAIHDAVLDAAREALVEYYLLQKAPDSDVMDALKSGMGSTALMKGIVGATKEKGAPAIPAHADGGVVTGITNGLAQVRAAAGEGLASIGKGERIVPANTGGGGGSATQRVVVEFRGDAKRMIQTVASDVYSRNRGRERMGS